MITKETHRNIRIVTSMSVMARRAMGRDKATIRREGLAVPTRSIVKEVEGLAKQEPLYPLVERCVNEAIARTRRG